MTSLKDEHLQWLALNEQLILLGDGLFRVNDPTERMETSAQASSLEDDLLLVDTCSSTQLMQKLRLCPRCLAEQTAYCQFTEYRFKALAYYWYVQQAQLEESRQKERRKGDPFEQQCPGIEKCDKVPFKMKMAFMMLTTKRFLAETELTNVELILSLSLVIFHTLRHFEPMQLITEKRESITNLEHLISCWLINLSQMSKPPAEPIEMLVACLIGLAQARGTLKSIISAVHTIQRLGEVLPATLKVSGIMKKLRHSYEIGWQSFSVFHLVTWSYDDTNLPEDLSIQNESECAANEVYPSSASDGHYIYINKQNGRLIKVGTGLHGTCRGMIYAHTDCEPGWLAYANGQLLFRPISIEEKDQDIEMEESKVKVEEQNKSSEQASVPEDAKDCKESKKEDAKGERKRGLVIVSYGGEKEDIEVVPLEDILKGSDESLSKVEYGTTSPVYYPFEDDEFVLRGSSPKYTPTSKEGSEEAEFKYTYIELQPEDGGPIPKPRMFIPRFRETKTQEGEPLPKESEAVVKESESVPKESESIPKESEAVPKETEVVAKESVKESESVPKESEAIPKESESVPKKSEAIPKESEAVPKEGEVVKEVESVPKESESVPKESEVIPKDSEAVPKESESVPKKSEAIPKESESVPKESEAVPKESEAIPKESESVPKKSEAVPKESEAVPKEGEVVPKEGESIPKEGESISKEGESVPKEGDSVPKEGESVPKEVEPVPKEGEPVAELKMQEGEKVKKIPESEESKQIKSAEEKKSIVEVEKVRSPSPAEPSLLCHVLDTESLKPVCSVFHPIATTCHHRETTSHLVGDGIRLYRVFQVPGIGKKDKKGEEFEARVETFELEVSKEGVLLVSLVSNVLLLRDQSVKDVSKPPSWFFDSPHYTSPGLSPYLKRFYSPTYDASKPLNSTSGITLRQLYHCACFSNGSFILFLFLSGNAFKKTLLTALCYRLGGEFAEYKGIWDLNYVASASMARSITSSLSTCYDPFNNSLWSCTQTWTDQWMLGVNFSRGMTDIHFGLAPDVVYDPPMRAVRCESCILPPAPTPVPAKEDETIEDETETEDEIKIHISKIKTRLLMTETKEEETKTVDETDKKVEDATIKEDNTKTEDETKKDEVEKKEGIEKENETKAIVDDTRKGVETSKQAEIEKEDVSKIEKDESKMTDETGKKEDQIKMQEDETKMKVDETGFKEDETGKKEVETGKKEDETGIKDDETGKKEDETGKKEDETGKKEVETGKKEDETGKKEDETEKKEDETGKKEDETGKKEGTKKKKGGGAALKPIPSSDVVRSMLYYAGLLACNNLYNKPPPDRYVVLLLPVMQKSVHLLDWVVSEQDRFLTLCMLYIIRAFVRSHMLNFDKDEEGRTVLNRLRYICTLLSNPPPNREDLDWVVEPIRREARYILFQHSSVLFTEEEVAIEISNYLDMYHMPVYKFLCDQMLRSLSRDLESIQLLDQSTSCVLPRELATRLLKIATKESIETIRRCATDTDEEFSRLLSTHPHISPILEYVQCYFIYQLKLLIIDPLVMTEMAENPQGSEELNTTIDLPSTPKKQVSEITAEISSVLECALEVYQEVYSVLSLLFTRTDPSQPGPERLTGLTRLTHGTILGTLLSFYIPSIACFYLSSTANTNKEEIISNVIDLITITAKVSTIYYAYINTTQDGKQFPRYKSLNEFFYSSKHTLADPKVPDLSKPGEKVLESIHPLRDDYKFKESVSIPGAKYLFLRFDTRCSTQLADSDILTVYSGRSNNLKKVAEYGGNVHGYGSRPIYGLMWPKEIVRIEGDTVMIQYEQRSRREGNIPDKVVWGFVVHVYGHESMVESSLPLFMDHFLGSLSVISDFLEEVYYGADESEEELNAAPILRLKFLQECDLVVEEFKWVDRTHMSRISAKIPEETIRKLMRTLNKPLPIFQPKFSTLIKPMLMLEMILSAIEKHLNFAIVSILHPDTRSEEEVELFSYIFNKAYGLLRKLQAIGNLENQWEMCVQDSVEGFVDETDSPFFVGLSEVESSQSDFELLCQVLDISLPSLESQNILTAVGKMQKLVRTEVKIRKGEFSWEEEELEKEREKSSGKDVKVEEKVDTEIKSEDKKEDQTATTEGEEGTFKEKEEIKPTDEEGTKQEKKEAKEQIQSSQPQTLPQELPIVDNKGGDTQLIQPEAKDSLQVVTAELEKEVPKPEKQNEDAKPEQRGDSKPEEQTGDSKPEEEKEPEKPKSPKPLPEPSVPFSKLNLMVDTLFDKLNLLFQVDSAGCFGARFNRSRSKDLLTTSESFFPPTYLRTVSVPRIMGELYRERQAEEMKPKCNKADIDQFFSYLGINLSKNVTANDIVKASKHCMKRAKSRLKAIDYIQQLLQLSSSMKWGALSLSFIIKCLGEGAMIDELYGSGFVSEVRDSFKRAFFNAVNLCISKPFAYSKNSIYLCITSPNDLYIFDDDVMTQSKLIKIIDSLLSCQSSQHFAGPSFSEEHYQIGTEEISVKNITKTISLAWGALQYLALQYIYKQDKKKTSEISDTLLTLSKQIAYLLENHLDRTMNLMATSEVLATSMLHSLLSLLLKLSKSKLGKELISQSSFVSKLLRLLLDHRPSPSLVYLTLQLCRVVLPLLTEKDCADILLPDYSLSVSFQAASFSAIDDSTELDASLVRKTAESNASNIIKLFLLKLGDFLVPDTTSYAGEEQEENVSEEIVITNPEEASEDDSRLTVCVHRRRGEEPKHALPLPIFQPENFDCHVSGLPFNPARLLNLVTALKDNTRAEYCSTSRSQALRTAHRLAGKQFLVSVGKPSSGKNSSLGGFDLKRQQSYDECKRKNEVLRNDPLRPFISGQVAVSMAFEIITMLHSLGTSGAAAWVSAIREVISDTLSQVSSTLSPIFTLCNSIHRATEGNQTPPHAPPRYFAEGKPLVAVLAILGGFKETIHKGAQIRVLHTDCTKDTGVVKEVLGQQSLALVSLHNGIETGKHRVPKEPFEIPQARLVPDSLPMIALDKLNLSEEMINSLLLIISQPHLDLGSVSPTVDASGPEYALCRLYTEIRTRAVLLLARLSDSYEMAKIILTRHPACLDQFLEVARQCNPGDRENILERQVNSLRMMYRDCARPPAPPITIKKTIERKNLIWDIERPYPRVSGVIMSNGMTRVDVVTDPIYDVKEFGVRLYSTEPLPPITPSFYWELELFHPTQDLGQDPIFYLGYAPQELPKADENDPWKVPQGACLLSSNGEVLHCVGDDPMKNVVFKLSKPLLGRDIIGMGWIRERNKSPVGRAYITVNGERVEQEVRGVCEGMFPCLCFLKKTKVWANFGTRNFSFSLGHHHRDAALNLPSAASAEEIARGFAALPFPPNSDSESDEETTPSSSPQTQDSKEPKPVEKESEGVKIIFPEADTPTEYNTKLFYHYELCRSLNDMVWIGPGGRVGLGEDIDKEAVDDVQTEAERDKLIKLLIKTWEDRVFPALDRRFRNDNERRLGRENIVGALQQGLCDFAVMIAESLYEHEPHTRPQNLKYPTLEEMKVEAEKLNIKNVKKNNILVIRRSPPETGGNLKFNTKEMSKTFGLTGIVLAKEESTNLVQVETYLENEGVLVRYWYPLDMLEKPPKGARKSNIPILRSQSINVYMHRALIKYENSLTMKYCQGALVNLLKHTELRLPLPSPPSFLIPREPLCISQELLITRISYLKQFSYVNLAIALPDSTQIPWSGLSSLQPSDCIDALNIRIPTLFYNRPDVISSTLSSLISECQDAHTLETISTEICSIFQQSSIAVSTVSCPIATTKESLDIEIPTAACILVSCKHISNGTIKKDEDKPTEWICETCTFSNPTGDAACRMCTSAKPPPKPSTASACRVESSGVVVSGVEGPWVRIFVYKGHPSSHKPPKNSVNFFEIVRYPNILSKDIAIQPYCGAKFPVLLLPENRIHLQMTCMEDPGANVEVFGIHPDLPLGLAFLQEFSNFLKQKNASLSSTPPKDNNNESLFDEEKPAKPKTKSTLPERPEHLTKDEQQDLLEALTSGDVPGFMMEDEATEPRDTSLKSEEVCEKPKEFLISDYIPLLKQCIEWLTEFIHSTNSHPFLREVLFSLLADLMHTAVSISPGSAPALLDSFRKINYLQEEIMELFDKELTLFPGKGSATAEDIKNLHLPTSVSRGGNGRFSSYFQALLNLIMAHEEVQKMTPFSELHTTLSIHKSDSGVKEIGDRGLPSGRKKDHRKPKRPAANEKKPIEKSKSKITDSWITTLSSNFSILEELYSQRETESLHKLAFESSRDTLSLSTSRRLLVITGLHPQLDPEEVSNAIKAVAVMHGGLVHDDLYLPLRKIFSPPTQTKHEPSQTKPTGNIPAPPPPVPPGSPQAEDKAKKESETEEKTASLVRPSPQIAPKLEDEKLAELNTPPSSQSSPSSSLSASASPKREVLELMGISVLELKHSSKATQVREELLREIPKYVSDPDDKLQSNLSVSLATSTFSMGEDQKLNDALEKYCKSRIFAEDRKDMKLQVRQATTKIFMSGIPLESRSSCMSERGTKEKVSKHNILNSDRLDNLLYRFFDAMRGKPTMAEYLNRIFRRWDVTKEGTINLAAFRNLCIEAAKKDVRSLARGLASCGYSLSGELLGEIATEEAYVDWTLQMDQALVYFVNLVCRNLSLTPSVLKANEIWPSPTLFSHHCTQPLQGVRVSLIRVRYVILSKLNSLIEDLIPFTDFRSATCNSLNLGNVLLSRKHLIFYDNQTKLLEYLIRSTARRAGKDPPVIEIDGLHSVEGAQTSPWTTEFYQGVQQLSRTPSPQLCVDLRQIGGEPTYAFDVRMPGVHGNAGSFRHFIWRIVVEIKSAGLPLFISCPSAGAGFHKDKYILNSTPMAYIEERLLMYLGMFIGVSLRANIPLPLDLMPLFWKQLLAEPLDEMDLYDVDRITYNTTQQLADVETEEDFEALLYEPLDEEDGLLQLEESPELKEKQKKASELLKQIREWCGDSLPKRLLFSQRGEYVSLIRRAKLKEYACERKMNAILCGIAATLPIHILNIFSPTGLEFKICGTPQIEIGFLKQHTKYSVGLLETDKHMQFFWQVLKSFSQEELRRFIKFACNLERIPSECPCSQGGEEIRHTPPFPMIIAAPDTKGSSNLDERFIRAETCIFQIKLPQYSTLEVMRDHLLYAINARRDPLWDEN